MEEEVYALVDLESTDLEGSAIEEALVSDGTISQSCLPLSEKDQNISISIEDDDSQFQEDSTEQLPPQTVGEKGSLCESEESQNQCKEDTTEQLPPQKVGEKRSLCESEESQNQCKKIKTDFELLEKASLSAIVKLDRLPEKLLMEYQTTQLSKNVVQMWTGWKAPNPKLKETISHLERIISDTEQLCRGRLASRKSQIEAEETAKQQKFLTVSKDNPSQTNSLTVPVDRETNLDKSNTVDIRHSEQPIKEEEGWCGFDLDTLSGNCRGFPPPSTRARDELMQKIKWLERNVSLVSMLEEVDTNVSPCYKAERNDVKSVKEVTSKETKEENNVKIRINQHLKDLLGHAAGNACKEPSFSYMVLTIMALQSSQEPSMSVKNILQYIQDQFPYYRTANTSWRKSVHQTILWSDIFVKMCSVSCQSKTSADHGGCWTVDLPTAEAILERAVDAQNRRAKGVLRFDRSISLSPLSTNEKNNPQRKKICKPIEIHQAIKPGNNVFEDITEKLNVSKIKRRKSKGTDMKNEDVYDKIHLILKAAKNLDSQRRDTVSEDERIRLKDKQNVEKNKDVDVKINQHLKDLMGFVANNPLMEPPFSYMVLAVMALKSSTQPSLPLNEIFQFIKDNFPFYRSENESWMNAVKRTINWSNTFVKACLCSCPVKKSQENGGCWSVESVTAEEILARAAEVYNKKGKENSLELVSNGPILNEVDNSEKDENHEVSTNVEECSKEKISHHITNEEFSNQTHDLQREQKSCVEHNNLSSNDSDDSVTPNSKGDVVQSKEKEHSPNSDACFSYNVNDKNMCHKSKKCATNELNSTNDNLTFYCRDCNDIFICVFHLKHHQCSEGGSTGYPCYLCHTKFIDVDKFCSHLVADHYGMVNKHDPSPLCWTIKNCNFHSSDNHAQCQLCPAAFPNPELLEAHVKFVHS